MVMPILRQYLLPTLPNNGGVWQNLQEIRRNNVRNGAVVHKEVTWDDGNFYLGLHLQIKSATCRQLMTKDYVYILKQ